MVCVLCSYGYWCAYAIPSSDSLNCGRHLHVVSTELIGLTKSIQCVVINVTLVANGCPVTHSASQYTSQKRGETSVCVWGGYFTIKHRL